MRARPLPPVPRPFGWPTAPASGLSWTYLLLLAASGAYAPFLALHLTAVGWSGPAIGGMMGGIAMVQLFAGPLAGVLADRIQRTDRLFGAMTFAAALALAAAAWAPGVGLTAAALLVVAAARAPSSVVLDGAVIRHLAAVGPSLAGYGQIRMWGSVGYLASGVVAGMIAAQRPSLALWLAAGFLLVVSLRRHALRAPAVSDPVQHAPEACPPARQILADRQLWILLAGATLHGAALTVTDMWMPTLLAARGWSVAWTGVAMFVGIGAEIVALARSGQMLARFGTGPLLILSGLLAAIRLAATAYAPWLWLVVGVQLLQGLVLGIWWVAVVAAVTARMPAAWRTRAQAMLFATAYGIGPLVASLLAALLVRDGDPRPLFLAATLLAVGGSAVLALGLATDGAIETLPAPPPQGAQVVDLGAARVRAQPAGFDATARSARPAHLVPCYTAAAGAAGKGSPGGTSSPGSRVGTPGIPHRVAVGGRHLR